MINSLRSGVSGIRSNQTRMDVIGNNIANVNTVAFKKARAAFQELLGQRLLGGGINPSTVGLGVGVASVDRSWSQGSLEYTNVATDLALNGDGFFLISNGTNNALTRAGNFIFNNAGELVTSSGLNVQGWAFDDTRQIDMSQLQNVVVDFVSEGPAQPKFTENAFLAGNLSADALAGEMITVSTAVYDEQGKAHQAVVEFTKTATANEWDYEIRYAGSTAPPPFADVAGTATFDIDGTLVGPATIALTWDAAYVASAAPFTFHLDTLTQYSGSTTMAVSDQDGFSAGQFVGYNIDSNGLLSLNYSNGEQIPAYQLAIGNVANPNGLEQRGENLFGVTTASGDLVTGRPNLEFQTSVLAGTLEGSNVDLATEFTDMIVTQRGYQASARVVTTSDELLQEVVQLKR